MEDSKSKRSSRSKKRGREEESKAKVIELGITKPSYNLQRPFYKNDFKTLRCYHKNKLFGFLQKLMRTHNWSEAYGVLSVLLKSTCKDKSRSANRVKYLAALELLRQDGSNFRNFQDVYDTWLRKSWSPTRETKERFLIQLEYIVFCLTQRKTDPANQAAIWLRQQREFAYHHISNLVVGLAYCQDWYETIRKEFPALDLNGSLAPKHSVMSKPTLDMLVENSRCLIVDDFKGNRCYCGTFVANDKARRCGDGQHLQQEKHKPRSFYMHTDESDDKSTSDAPEKFSFSGHASILCAQGLEPWLLPSQILYTVKNLDEFLSLQKKVHNESYKGALKYFRLALNSTPPTTEALFPLVQMLLMGDQVKEAIQEVEKIASRSDRSLYLRLEASLFYQFDSNNHIYLSTCFENALKRDPACTYSLKRLLSLHHHVDYSSAKKLLKMVALHLDATYAECSIWKEFASCFLKLSLSEEDRISTCFAGNGEMLQQKSNNFKRKPVIVANSLVGEDWKLRCRWWKTRHFSQSILASEFEAGDMQLLTYKAASACHLYGPEFVYVRKVSDCVKKDRNSRGMYSFLQKHMQIYQ